MKVLNSLVLGAFLVGTLGLAETADADSKRRRHRNNDRSFGECRPIAERMEKSRRYIREWDRSGRHEKAVRWHKEDIVRQQRALRDCQQRTRYDDRRDYDYGRYDDDPWYGSYDPSADDRYGRYDDDYDGGIFGGAQGDPLGAILGSLLGTR